MHDLHIIVRRQELSGEGIYVAFTDPDKHPDIKKLRLGRNLEEALQDLGKSLDLANIDIEIKP